MSDYPPSGRPRRRPPQPGMRNLRGNFPALTEQQARELRDRYRLYLQNCPKKIMAEYGLSEGSFRRYVAPGYRPKHWQLEDGT